MQHYKCNPCNASSFVPIQWTTFLSDIIRSSFVTLQCRSNLHVSKWQEGPCARRGLEGVKRRVILRDRLPKTAAPKNASVAEATNNLVVRFLGGTHEAVQRWVDSLKIESRLYLFIMKYNPLY